MKINVYEANKQFRLSLVVSRKNKICNNDDKKINGLTTCATQNILPASLGEERIPELAGRHS